MTGFQKGKKMSLVGGYFETAKNVKKEGKKLGIPNYQRIYLRLDFTYEFQTEETE